MVLVYTNSFRLSVILRDFHTVYMRYITELLENEHFDSGR